MAEIEEKERQAAVSRDAIDKTQSNAGGTHLGSVNATVDFKNAPAWVKTDVGKDGKFIDLRVSRSTPQDSRAGAGLNPYSQWYFE